MNSTDFLVPLSAAVAGLRTTAQTRLVPLPEATLHQRPAPGHWSALECLEHLNRYSRYYLPALAQALARAGTPPAASLATKVGYSWLGRKSVNLMRPENAQKQATLRRLNPLGQALDHRALVEFDQHAATLLVLLEQARAANLNRAAVPVEFFRLLKLRVGEALEFVVVHQQRHMQQALRAAGAP